MVDSEHAESLTTALSDNGKLSHAAMLLRYFKSTEYDAYSFVVFFVFGLLLVL